jgi:fatty acid amide hydrolase
MARHVDDLLLAMRALSSTTDAGRDWLETPVPLGEPSNVELTSLRVGVYTNFECMPAAPAIQRAVNQAAAALEQAGVVIEPFQPPQVEAAWRCYLSIFYGDGLTDLKRQLSGTEVDHRIRHYFRLTRLPALARPFAAWVADRMGQRHVGQMLRWIERPVLPTTRYQELQFEQHKCRQRFLQALDRQQLDAVLGPPCAIPAFPHDDFFANATMVYTALYNLLALPAGVVPMTRVRTDDVTDVDAGRDLVDRSISRANKGSAGLPVGVHVAARWWREDIVLAVMRALERLCGEDADYPRCPPGNPKRES